MIPPGNAYNQLASEIESQSRVPPFPAAAPGTVVMTRENPQKKTRFQRYSFTQAMYNWKPQKQGPEPKFGMGLAILFFVVVALVCYAIYRLM